MTIAQRILNDYPGHEGFRFAEMQKMRNECREIAVSIGSNNCNHREFVFYDGSAIHYENGQMRLA